MKTCFLFTVVAIFIVFANLAGADQAGDTTITITAKAPGVTPFIDNVTLLASQTSVLKSIQFKIAPKPGSVTRALSATYSRDYLTSRGFLHPATGQIILPVYGLYAGYANAVTLTYAFLDGSSKEATTTISTTTFNDPCGYTHPTVLQARTNSDTLSYDYIMIKGACSTFSPAIIDTDGALRWVGTTGLASFDAAFFDNGVYLAHGTALYRNELDGTFRLLGDYSNIGVADFHHNVDRGKVGLLLEADTASYVESVVIEVDLSGNVLKTWNLASIISAAMTAGGDDPAQFVSASPNDWFHNNAVTYNRADDSLIVSSREDFLICIDYKTNAIKWILGDPTKKWHQFPSLRQYALALAPGSLPPIGQHAVSITYDQHVLVFDNGQTSSFQIPTGAQRRDARPRKYRLDLSAKVATEVWNYSMSASVYSPFCGSVYEDAPLNYLVDYALVNGPTAPNPFAELVGLDALGAKIFHYQYPTSACNTIFNAIPLHLGNTALPSVGPQALNLSTRGIVSADDNTLIVGFIVSGSVPKTMVLRALGPSLSAVGVSHTIADPDLTLYNASGAVIAENDDWQTRPGASYIVDQGLAPTDPAESALLQTLTPGAYTAVVRSKDSTSGIGLVEAYDLSPGPDSMLANISTRGSVGVGDNVLISGFIVGNVESTTVIVRALGPSLASYHVSGTLSDPNLTIYDNNGSAIASNDNWTDDLSALQIQAKGLAPANPAEAATALHLPPGAYTAIVRGTGGSSGTALLEVYDIP